MGIDPADDVTTGNDIFASRATCNRFANTERADANRFPVMEGE
jgi:hypothetical protein